MYVIIMYNYIIESMCMDFWMQGNVRACVCTVLLIIII